MLIVQRRFDGPKVSFAVYVYPSAVFQPSDGLVKCERNVVVMTTATARRARELYLCITARGDRYGIFLLLNISQQTAKFWT
jgi:hypothetical protein